MLQVLVFSKLLTPDRVEPIRRTAKTKSTSVEEAIVDLGLLTDVQIADALARYAGLRFVKINPLDLDLDVVTTALSGPFARRHGLIAISKNATTLTVNTVAANRKPTKLPTTISIHPSGVVKI